MNCGPRYSVVPGLEPQWHNGEYYPPTKPGFGSQVQIRTWRQSGFGLPLKSCLSTMPGYSDEAIKLDESDCEESEESADVIDNIPVNPDILFTARDGTEWIPHNNNAPGRFETRNLLRQSSGPTSFAKHKVNDGGRSGQTKTRQKYVTRAGMEERKEIWGVSAPKRVRGAPKRNRNREAAGFFFFFFFPRSRNEKENGDCKTELASIAGTIVLFDSVN
ncbi:uncharacterized protein TNCV_4136321 [Trichonephila clavipes]|nr:uncharacterized protein TNCV_4136321 [Trichonephila clavipes]